MKRFFIRTLSAVFAATTIAGGALAEETPASEPAGAMLPAITVHQVESRTLRDRIVASGLIGPVERVVVQPQIQGQAINELLADVGDTVKAGDVMARLSDSALKLQKSQLLAARASAQAALAQAAAQLVETRAAADEAERARERTVQLSQQGTASSAARDQAVSAATAALARVNVAEQGLKAAEAQVEVAEAQIADVELNLRRTEVAAPVDGEITERNATVGSIASAAGEPMFVIVRDGMLELRADVAEQDVLRLAPGQQAEVRAIGLTAPIAGTVRLVEPTVAAATRLGRVRISFENSASVRSGLFAEADILLAERVGPAVPGASVSVSGDATSVLVVDDAGKVSRRPVVTGIRDGGYVEIVSGLEVGERIVARAGAFVRDGDRINPMAEELTAASSN